MTMNKFLNIHFFIALAVFASLMVSCTAKQKADNLKETIGDVISKIEKDASSITKEDWEKYDKEIEQITEKIKTDRNSYTPEQTEKMNKMIGKYYALKA